MATISTSTSTTTTTTYRCLPFLIRLEGIIKQSDSNKRTASYQHTAANANTKKAKTTSKTVDDDKKEWVIASKIVTADTLEKKNTKKSPPTLDASLYALVSDNGPLRTACIKLRAFLIEVIHLKEQIELVKPKGRKTYKWFHGNDTKLRALLPTLRRNFYPRGIPQSAKHRCSSDAWIGKAVDDKIGEHFKNTGNKVFTKYYEAMSCDDECKSKLSKSAGEFGEDDAEAGGKGECLTIDEGNEDDAKKAKSRKRMYTIYSNAIISELEKKGIIIAAVQVPVYDPRQRIISFIDAVGLCMSTCKILILEFKTGYDYAYTFSYGKMDAPLENIPCSAKNIHMMQLAWYLDVCRRLYGLHDLTHDDGFLLKVNSKNTRVNPIKAPDGSEYIMNGEWFKLDIWTTKKREAITAKLESS